MRKPGKIMDIIGVPSDFGIHVPGASMGPAALRSAGLHEKLRATGLETVDQGDIPVPNRYQVSAIQSVQHHLPVIETLCKKLKKSVLSSLTLGHLPLVLGGDHSVAIGSLAAVCEYYRAKRIGLIWIDAHADINTPASTLTGNIHGMPMSVLLGNGYPELTQLVDNQKTIQTENIVYLGLRDLDPGEKIILQSSGIAYYTMRNVDEKGIGSIVQEIGTRHFQHIEGVYVSFDMDVLDPQEVPGVSTPCRGGLTVREAHLLLEILSETQSIVAADIVELNPFKDLQGQSAVIATDLICSLFGKTII